MNQILSLLLLFLAGCGSINKWALRSATPLFEKSSTLSTQEKNWNTFREATPANLRFTELLALQDPDNLSLLALLIKGYAGYAYAVPETLFFQDELSGLEESSWKNEALHHYTRALDYGLLYLKKKNLSHLDLLNLDEKKLIKKLKKNLDQEDLPAVLYTAQAWGSLINLQKDNVALISQIPRVKIMFDYVCSLDPKIEHGVCDLFYAQYEASRPRMLGGNPEKARELYQLAFEKYPKNLLMRLSFIQYLLIPGMELEAYQKEAVWLKTEFSKWENSNRNSLEDTSEYRDAREINLYNAIAKKRFEAIEKFKAKIF